MYEVLVYDDVDLPCGSKFFNELHEAQAFVEALQFGDVFDRPEMIVVYEGSLELYTWES